MAVPTLPSNVVIGSTLIIDARVLSLCIRRPRDFLYGLQEKDFEQRLALQLQIIYGNFEHQALLEDFPAKSRTKLTWSGCDLSTVANNNLALRS